MSSSDIAISVRGLSKSYTIAHNQQRATTLAEALMRKLRHPFRSVDRETFWALKDVSFDVKKGEVVGIIGRNGAGKSTLLKVLSRITEPTTGEIDLYGRVGSLLEVGTGFHPELTGRENIYLNGGILGMSRGEIKKQFDAIVDFAEVEKFLDTPVKRYSSGMYVRLAFAVAAHLNPEILIVDEVLAVGDQAFQQKCLGKMKDVAQSGRTVLFVSHNMAAVAELCTRGIFLQKGQLREDSVAAEVVRHYLNAGTTPAAKIDLRDWSLERSGDGPMQIVGLSICDEANNPQNFYLTDQPWRVKVQIESDRSREIILCVSIRNGQGTMLLHLCNTDDAAKLAVQAGTNEIVVHPNHHLLNDGVYYVTVWLGDATNLLHDRVGNSLSFTIDNSSLGANRCQAPFKVPAAWYNTSDALQTVRSELL